MELQKTAIPDTGTYFGSANVQVQKFHMANNITCTLYWNYRVDGALYAAETWFVAGVNVNTLYKYNNK
jgi:hypothetical protein